MRTLQTVFAALPKTYQPINRKAHRDGRAWCILSDMEREKRFELSTYTLARYRSTN